ncbi:MAG TPA: dihydropteroate synthase [Thermodesulfobacteriota bacterium]|nr:dihydropteroate synthase [Thermodesulfobacteriota bacterium]
MGKVGVAPTGMKLMEGKTIHLNLKVEGITPRASNLLKQEMLSLGGDAAVDGRGLDCSTELTDAILIGTHKQFERLTSKLEQYPVFQDLIFALKSALKNLSKTHYTLRCRKRTFVLGKKTLLMGVLNVTPDSFSDGGLFFEKEKAVAQGLKMVEEGADLIDIGGESTRPGSRPLDPKEELRRVIPVIESLVQRTDVPISIDTYKSFVAREAIRAGAAMINDISGLHFDLNLADVGAKEKVPMILMHIRGTPETMQTDIHYDALFSEIIQSLRESVHHAESAGVDPDQIIIDPGIGFGKTLEHNLLLLKHLSEFRILGKPLLVGTSRKSFIGKILKTQEVSERLEGTLASIAIGVLNGAHIIRCHDVLQAKKAIAVADAIRLAES